MPNDQFCADVGGFISLGFSLSWCVCVDRMPWRIHTSHNSEFSRATFFRNWAKKKTLMMTSTVLQCVTGKSERSFFFHSTATFNNFWDELKKFCLLERVHTANGCVHSRQPLKTSDWYSRWIINSSLKAIFVGKSVCVSVFSVTDGAGLLKHRWLVLAVPLPVQWGVSAKGPSLFTALVGLVGIKDSATVLTLLS